MPSFGISTFNRLIEVMKALNDVLCDSAGGSECQIRWSGFYKRLAKIMSKSSRTQSSNCRQGIMPHEAILQLMHSSTLAKLRLHTSQQQGLSDVGVQSQNWSFPALEQYTSQLQDCCVALGAQHMPPLVEYSALLALQGLHAIPSPRQQDSVTENSRCKLQVYNVALAGSGQAFKELEESTYTLIQEDLVLSEEPRDDISSNRQGQSQAPRSSGRATTDNQTEERLTSNGPQLKAGPNQPDTSNSVLAQDHAPLSALSGKGQSSTAVMSPLTPQPPNQISTSTLSNRNNASDRPSEPLAHQSDPNDFTWIDVACNLGDVDAVFLSLAHLDTTEWQVPHFVFQHSSLRCAAAFYNH
jgi:hypothetical protein